MGTGTALAIFLGEALLIPILEVGAIAAALAWMAACASYYRMKPAFVGRAAALIGLLVTSFMVLAKLLPLLPGHFTRYEWIALAVWSGLGVLAAGSRRLGRISTPELEATDVASTD